MSLYCVPFQWLGNLVKADGVGGEVMDSSGQVEEDGGDEPGHEGGVGGPRSDRLLPLLLQRGLQIRDFLGNRPVSGIARHQLKNVNFRPKSALLILHLPHKIGQFSLL